MHHATMIQNSSVLSRVAALKHTLRLADALVSMCSDCKALLICTSALQVASVAEKADAYKGRLQIDVPSLSLPDGLIVAQA